METSEENQTFEQDTEALCDGCCRQTEVTNYCLQCSANLCEGCKLAHCNTRLTRHHPVLPNTHPDVLQAKRTRKIYCQKHTGKEYVTYCVKCRLPCCATCISEEHNGHTFCDLEKMISKTESEVKHLLHELQTELIPVTEKAISKLGKEIQSYKTAMDDVKHSVKKKVERHTQDLSKSHEAFITQVDEHGEKDLAIMDTKKQAEETRLEEMEFAARKGRAASADAFILRIKDELAEISAKGPSRITCPGNILFSASSIKLSSFNEIIGSINNGTEKILINAAVNDQHIVRLQTCSEKKVKTRVINTVEAIYALSMVIFRNDTIWIFNEKDKAIEIYNAHIKKTNKISVGFSLENMTLYGINTVIALDKDNKRVVRISSSGSIDELFRIAKRCSGICVNSKQEVVVGVLDNVIGGNRIWKLVVFSPDGFSARQEITDDQLFTGYISTPQVRQTTNEDYVVAIGNKIIFLSKEWEPRWTYEIGQQHHLLVGLFCDKYNNILFGNASENEIIMINAGRQFVRTLFTEKDGISCPSSMAVDKKERLWIGQKNNVLITTTYPKK